MAPAVSKLRAEARLGALPRRALAGYLRLLQLYPVLTKAATRSARSGRDRAGGDPARGRRGDPAAQSLLQGVLCERRSPRLTATSGAPHVRLRAFGSEQ